MKYFKIATLILFMFNCDSTDKKFLLINETQKQLVTFSPKTQQEQKHLLFFRVRYIKVRMIT